MKIAATHTKGTKMTTTENLERLLKSIGRKPKTVRVYGSQVVVTCRSHSEADKIATLLSAAFTIRGVIESVDYAKENKGTCLVPTTFKVWRVFARA